MTRSGCQTMFAVTAIVAIGVYFLFQKAILAKPWWVYALIFAGAIIANIVVARFDPHTVSRAPGVIAGLLIACYVAYASPKVGIPLLFVMCVVGWSAVIATAILDVTVFRNVPKIPTRDLEALIEKMRQEQDRKYYERGKAMREEAQQEPDFESGKG